MPNPVAAYVRTHGNRANDDLVRNVPLRDVRLAHNTAPASPRPRQDSMRSVEEFTSLEALTNGGSKRPRIIRGWTVAFVIRGAADAPSGIEQAATDGEEVV